MALFSLKKKKEEKKPCCCCCSKDSPEDTVKTAFREEIVSIKVLGAGCKACHEQYEHARSAANNLGLNVEVEYITDMAKVMEYGVMSMPAIVVNERVLTQGTVLKASYIEGLLKASF